MSGLWTVTINRLHMVKKFDKDGKLVGETVTRIPVTIRDLPYATAQMYADKAPGEVTIVEQIAEFSKPYKARPFEYKHHKGRDDEPPVHLASEDIEHHKELIEAAASGDLAAAINTELEGAA